jgi:cytochrome c-type biogenesis protein CcmH
MVLRNTLMLLLMLVVTSVVFAKEAEPLAADPALEKKVYAITSELRCLVCQNQTIAESHADLAIDLKNQVRGMVKAGETEDQIKKYMVHRYGDFVLYRPPLKKSTYLLWTGPFLLLVIGFAVLLINVRRRRTLVADDAPLSAEEAQKLDTLLHKQDAKSGEGESKS